MRKRRGGRRDDEKDDDKPEEAVVPLDPHNEAVLVAAAMASREVADELLPSISPDHFFAKGHPRAWEVLREMRAKGLYYDPRTVSQMSGGEVDVEYLEGLLKERPERPPNLAHHVDALRWDKARVDAARGPLAALLASLRDVTSPPDKVRSLARQLSDSFHGHGSAGYLVAARDVARSHAAVLEDRMTGHACWSTGIPTLDVYADGPLTGRPRLIPGTAPGKITCLTGVSGCLVGDAMIGVNRAGKGGRMRLAHVVHMFNGGRSSGKVWDSSIPTMVAARDASGFVRLKKLVAAYESGEKMVYEISIRGGASLRATLDHRFLTENGWRRLGELRVGDRVWVDAGDRGKGSRKKKPCYLPQSGLVHHPQASNRNAAHKPSRYAVPRHRVVVEASLNGLTFEEYVRRLKVGEIEGLEFLPREMVVHHKDENPKNNELWNLEVMTTEEHARLHGLEGWRNIVFRTRLVQVIGIVERGCEPTFDLEMEGPEHNFIANGFVVHNSGKTTTAAQMILGMTRQGRRVLVGAWETGEAPTLELLATMSLNLSRTDVMTGQYDAADKREILEEMERLGELVKFFRLPFGKARSDRGGSQNDRQLDLIRQVVADSRAEVFVADLMRRAMKETKPDDEDQFLYRLQADGAELGVHQVWLHQIRLKDVEGRPDKRPTREGMKGSSGWVEVPDAVIGFHREALWKDVEDRTLEAIVLKQRYGPWPLAVEFEYDPEFGVVSNGRCKDYARPGESSDLDSFLGGGRGRGRRH